MGKYLAYTRVSTEKQGEGVSLQEQKAAIERFATREGLVISEWFEEKMTAAKRGGRPAFTKMMQKLGRREARGVIMHKIDRSARNLKDWADLGDLIDQGVEIHFANEGLDLQSRGGRLSADIQAVVAADYIRNLREETKKGLYGRLKQGVWPWPAPLGYNNEGAGKPKTIDSASGPLIREAFELYATGQWSLRQLSEELHRRGLQTKSGKALSAQRLQAMLHEPFYMGLMRVKKTGEAFKGAHKALISKRLFDKVQLAFQRRNRPQTSKHSFTFSRLISCEVCGKALIGEKQKGHIYYRCHDRACPMTSIREDRFESRMALEFENLAFTKPEWKILEEELDRLADKRSVEMRGHVEQIRLRLGQLEARISKLADTYLDGDLEKEVFVSQKERILREKVGLEEGLENRLQVDVALNRVRDYLELARSPWLSYQEAQVREKRELVEELTSNRSASLSGGFVELAFPYATIANRNRVSCGAPQQNALRIKNQNGPRTGRQALRNLLKKLTGDLEEKSKLSSEKI